MRKSIHARMGQCGAFKRTIMYEYVRSQHFVCVFVSVYILAIVLNDSDDAAPLLLLTIFLVFFTSSSMDMGKNKSSFFLSFCIATNCCGKKVREQNEVASFYKATTMHTIPWHCATMPIWRMIFRILSAFCFRFAIQCDLFGSGRVVLFTVCLTL